MVRVVAEVAQYHPLLVLVPLVAALGEEEMSVIAASHPPPIETAGAVQVTAQELTAVELHLLENQLQP
jgi:hypothetical protein